MLIIFDLDDTLINTTEKLTPILLKRALKIMIKKGLQVKDKKSACKKLLQIDKTSTGSKESLKKFLCFINAKQNFYDIAIKTMRLPLEDDIKIFTLKGAKSVLKYLSNDHSLALVSLGKEKFQFDKIQKAGIDTSIFSKIVITRREDKGLHYKRIIEKLKFSFQETYVCGDKINIDLVPAKKMGCKTIHMKWGRGKNLLDDKNVDFTIKSLNEIKEILDQKK